ncbi:MAG: CoA-transferase [Candidatus Bathyarchaeota archaeon]
MLNTEENKRLGLNEAIEKFVEDGNSITFGGFCGRVSMAAALEIVRQKKKNLTLIDDSKNDETDILIGAGCIKRWEGAYLSHGVPGLSRNFRRSIEHEVPFRIEVEEGSNYAMSLRFLAGALNVPFLPTKSLLGSDIPKYNPKIKIIKDPYEGKPLALVPAAHPDLAIIHVQRADALGNAQILGFLANDENKARAAKHTIITCEKIVPTDEIRKIPNLTTIPFYCVDAVVEVPYGSYWWSLTGYYTYDIMFSKDFVKENGTREGFLAWLDKWVYSCEDHKEFLEKVGLDRIRRVTEIEHMCNKVPW